MPHSSSNLKRVPNISISDTVSVGATKASVLNIERTRDDFNHLGTVKTVPRNLSLVY